MHASPLRRRPQPPRRPALAQSRTRRAVGPTPAPAAQRRHPRDGHEPPLTPAAPRHCRTCGEPLVVLFRLFPHKNRPPSCRREVTSRVDMPLSGESMRQGVHHPTSATCQDYCCLDTLPQAPLPACLATPRPRPCCQTASWQVAGYGRSPGDPPTRRLPGLSPPLPPIETPKGLIPLTGLFNPALCGGSAPHEFLIR
jgi:hypothetical protein